MYFWFFFLWLKRYFLNCVWYCSKVSTAHLALGLFGGSQFRLWCANSCCFIAYDAWHWSHLNGCSPVCRRRCMIRYACVVNFLLQNSHLLCRLPAGCFYTQRYITVCIRQCTALLNVFYDRSFQWLLRRSFGNSVYSKRYFYRQNDIHGISVLEWSHVLRLLIKSCVLSYNRVQFSIIHHSGSVCVCVKDSSLVRRVFFATKGEKIDTNGNHKEPHRNTGSASETQREYPFMLCE